MADMMSNEKAEVQLKLRNQAFNSLTAEQRDVVNALGDIEYILIKKSNGTNLGSKAHKKYTKLINALEEAWRIYIGVPRLLTLDEMREEKCHPVHWYQSRNHPTDNDYAQVYFALNVEEQEYGCSLMRPGIEEDIWERFEDYGKTWRCWTAPVYCDVPWESE